MRNRQASVVFVLITLFIDILGMGLVIPILPRLVQSMLGGAISDASFVFGLLVSIYSVMQFFCAPILGALSDRFGRRPVILLALAGWTLLLRTRHPLPTAEEGAVGLEPVVET